jgi:hypothetical protein
MALALAKSRHLWLTSVSWLHNVNQFGIDYAHKRLHWHSRRYQTTSDFGLLISYAILTTHQASHQWEGVPTTKDKFIQLLIVEVDVRVWFMSRNDIMHEHNNHTVAWLPLPGAFHQCMAHRYLAVNKGVNYSGERVPIEYTVNSLLRIWRRHAGVPSERRYLPVEKYPYLVLHFYDTYTYYISRIY